MFNSTIHSYASHTVSACFSKLEVYLENFNPIAKNILDGKQNSVWNFIPFLQVTFTIYPKHASAKSSSTHYFSALQNTTGQQMFNASFVLPPFISKNPFIEYMKDILKRNKI